VTQRTTTKDANQHNLPANIVHKGSDDAVGVDEGMENSGYGEEEQTERYGLNNEEKAARR